MKIIDIHSHIHMRETLVQEQENNLLRDMERFGIERRLISAIGDESIEKKNRCIEELIARHPKELIGCGVINPKEENALEETGAYAPIPISGLWSLIHWKIAIIRISVHGLMIFWMFWRGGDSW